MPEMDTGGTTSLSSATSQSLKPDFENALQKIEENRRLRHTKFPSLKGRYSFNSCQGNVNIITNCSRWNDQGELRPIAPHRIYDSLIDPTSGFVGTGCNVDSINNEHTHVQSMVQLNHTPQSMTPKSHEKIQNIPATLFELKRLGTWCPGSPTAWNSRKTLDVWIKAKLGGWTSDEDPRKVKDLTSWPQTSVINDQNQSIEDKLAVKYMYGASTQRGYEDVPWDIILRPKQWPPALAVGDKSEILLYQRNAKSCNPTRQEWKAYWPFKRKLVFRPKLLIRAGLKNGCTLDKPQAVTHGSDQLLSRYPQKTERHVTFGGVEAENSTDGMEKYEQLKRRMSAATHSCEKTQPFSQDKPHYDYKKKSPMSKMVTLVPPYNPSNVVEKEPVHV